MSPKDFAKQTGEELDRERLISFDRQEWCYLMCNAVAEVVCPLNKNTSILQYLSSGWIDGIESDSGEDYLKEIALDRLVELRVVLQKFNVNLSNYNQLLADLNPVALFP